MKILQSFLALGVKIVLFIAFLYIFMIYVFPDLESSQLSKTQINLAKACLTLLSIYLAEIIFLLNKHLNIEDKYSE